MPKLLKVLLSLLVVTLVAGCANKGVSAMPVQAPVASATPTGTMSLLDKSVTEGKPTNATATDQSCGSEGAQSAIVIAQGTLDHTNYYLQLGSFVHQSVATSWCTKLSGQLAQSSKKLPGLPGLLVHTAHGFSKVQMGPFASAKTASQTAEHLHRVLGLSTLRISRLMLAPTDPQKIDPVAPVAVPARLVTR